MTKDRTRELYAQQLPCRFYGGDYKSCVKRATARQSSIYRFIITSLGPFRVLAGFYRDGAKSHVAKDYRLTTTARLIDNHLEEYDIAPKILSLRAAKSWIISV